MTALDPVILRLLAEFPVEGATQSGTQLLFLDEAESERNLQALTWLQVAKQITGIVDIGLVHSMKPADFRYYLPGLLLGVMREPVETDTLGSAVLFGLHSYQNPEYWDDDFVEKWCRFTAAQYDLLENLIEPILPDHLGEFYGISAMETLGLAKMHAADLRGESG